MECIVWFSPGRTDSRIRNLNRRGQSSQSHALASVIRKHARLTHIFSATSASSCSRISEEGAELAEDAPFRWFANQARLTRIFSATSAPSCSRISVSSVAVTPLCGLCDFVVKIKVAS